MNEQWRAQLSKAVGTPHNADVTQARERVQQWFAATAPLIQWDQLESPLGTLYVAASSQGLWKITFGVPEGAFLQELDPLARLERNSAALEAFSRQLQEYFAGERHRFDLPVDIQRLTPFQRQVLQTIRQVPAGSVWSYREVAQAIGKPQASRAVGQAVGRNPVPIVIPCHRIVQSGGRLGGYSASGGVESKRLLLQLEGAI